MKYGKGVPGAIVAGMVGPKKGGAEEDALDGGADDAEEEDAAGEATAYADFKAAIKSDDDAAGLSALKDLIAICAK